MSYHIYGFYSSEPGVVRVMLAISFDIMVVVCFYLLKDPLISKLSRAKRATWCVLMVLIVFQLYVNIWAYWHEGWGKAIIQGSIFPITVALISYIGMLRQQQAEKLEAKEADQQQATTKIQQIASPVDAAELANEKPWKDKRVPKSAVIEAYKQLPTEAGKEVFRGASNWRSVGRWWGKLKKGETI